MLVSTTKLLGVMAITVEFISSSIKNSACSGCIPDAEAVSACLKHVRFSLIDYVLIPF